MDKHEAYQKALENYKLARAKWETLIDARHIIAEFSIENIGKDETKADNLWEARNHLNSFIDKAKKEAEEKLKELNKAYYIAIGKKEEE